MHWKLLICIFIGAAVSTKSLAPDFPGLQGIFNYLGTDFSKHKDVDEMSIEELGLSRGECFFRDYVRYVDRLQCTPADKHILHLQSPRNKEARRKPPIRVKCLQPDPTDNATAVENNILMMDSVKDIVSLLKPIGNATKRHEPGSCVLVIFYTESSLACARWAPFINILPSFFPTLRIAAIDALRFPSFNTDFGIVGLPTLLLFHQGRPIVKYYNSTFLKLIDKHTGIKPTYPGKVPNDGPLPLKPIKKTDYILILAWTFILFCTANHFAKSHMCHQIVDVIKRNWRESEAQLERN